MKSLDLYENKIIDDKDFPAQLIENKIDHIGNYFSAHWHEHLELHYVIQGEAVIYSGQTPHEVEVGNLVIINSNEIHWANSRSDNLYILVIIFELGAYSFEIAKHGIMFQEMIQSDKYICELFTDIFEENKAKLPGYKLVMRGKIYGLIAYLIRNYTVNQKTGFDSSSRIRNKERLEKVLTYIQKNYTRTITNNELAHLIHLSEYRFLHVFKECMGTSPINYINEIRVNKAYQLLKQKELTVTQIASIVGFQDFNNFGRIFRKYYGHAPSKVWEMQNEEVKNK